MSDLEPETKQLHQWLQRMRDGDDTARNDLVRGVCKRMEHLVRKMLRHFPNVARWMDTEDVLQNALMRLLHSLQQVQPESMRAFYSLAAMHVRRELLDLARQLYGPHGLGANHDSVCGNAHSGPTPWETVAHGDAPEDFDRWCRFHEEVEKLPVEHREVISLVFYHGWTQTQVAELFQVNERTIRRRWQEALQSLRTALEGSIPGAR